MQIKRILVAVDGSEHSDKAVEVAAELARTHGGSVTVLHVVPDVPVYSTPPGLEEFSRLENTYITQRDLMMSAATTLVDRAADRIENLGLDRPETRIQTGSPANEIVEVAAELGADAVVMGSRGLGNLQSVLLGSTSHRVTHLAPCTVVTVK